MNFDDTKKALSSTFKQHTMNLAVWACFLTLSLLVYYFLSSGDFSFLLTYASFMRCFAFALLSYKIFTHKSASNISLKTLQLYFFVFLSRLLSIMRHQGYLPFDKTGDWFYHFVESMSLLFIIFIYYFIFTYFISSYNEKYDKFGNKFIPNELGVVWVFVPCLLLAMLFHPSLNKEFFSDTCWTFSMYLEAVAMLPQIYMFHKQANDEGGTVEALIGHTMFTLSFSRLFELIFWLGSFKELSDISGGRLPGYIVLLSQLGQLLLMSDFFFYYFKSISRGLPMELPTSYSSIV